MDDDPQTGREAPDEPQDAGIPPGPEAGDGCATSTTREAGDESAPAATSTAGGSSGMAVAGPDQVALAELVPGWITRFMVSAVLAVVFLYVADWVLGRIADVIAALIVALFLSFALEPAVNWLVAHRWNRRVASLVLVLLVVVMALGFLASLMPVLIDQVRLLIDEAPSILRRIGDFTEQYLNVTLSTEWITEQLSAASSRLTALAGSVAGDIFGVGLEVVKIIFLLLATILFTYYLVSDAPRLRRFVLGFMRKERQERVLWTWELAIDKTGGYLYSRAILAAISSVLMFVVLLILDVPYAVPLAMWQGVVSQFLPTFGTYVGGVVPLLVTLTISPWAALALLIYLIVYQLFENHVIGPPLTARTMRMHAGLAFGAALAGAALYGVIGALLALPLAAVGQAAVTAYGQRFEVLDDDLTRYEPAPPEAGTRAGTAVLSRVWGAILAAGRWVGRVMHLRRPPKDQ